MDRCTGVTCGSRVAPTLRSRCRVIRLRPLVTHDVAAAAAAVTRRPASDPEILNAAGAAEGSVARALAFLDQGTLALRQDVLALFDLLQQQKITPLIAQRWPLAEARHAHELLGQGGVTGKIVLVVNGSSLDSGVV